jgi:hypothetical protein
VDSSLRVLTPDLPLRAFARAAALSTILGPAWGRLTQRAVAHAICEYCAQLFAAVANYADHKTI